MRTLRLLLAAAALLSVSGAAFAADRDAIGALKQQIKDLTTTLSEMTARLEKLEAAAAAPAAAPAARPAAMRGEGAGPLQECWFDRVCVTGYAQNRYERRQDTNSDFNMRRMYLTFIGTIGDRAKGVISFDRVGPDDPQINLYLAMVDYQLNDDWSVQFGQVNNTFGIDAAESSARRLPFDRSPVLEGIPTRYAPGHKDYRPGLPGLYFKGPADRGIYLTRKPRNSNEPKIILGVVNGNFAAGDDNASKLPSVDIKWERPWGVFGASWMSGKFVNPTTKVDEARRALDIFAHVIPRPWGFQGEWVTGKLLGHDIEGWYGQVAYAMPEKKLTPYFRYERYDPNTDLSGDTYKGWRLGAAYQVDKYNEVTVEYWNGSRNVPSPVSGGNGGDYTWNDVDYGQFGLQWQVGF